MRQAECCAAEFSGVLWPAGDTYYVLQYVSPSDRASYKVLEYDMYKLVTQHIFLEGGYPNRPFTI